jgi:hypothetical protein
MSAKKPIKGVKYVDHYRDIFNEDNTLGYINLDNELFCYTLEDTARAYGVKVFGKTCIPENIEGYEVDIHTSNKFKRDVLILYTEADGVTLVMDGISFKYVYAHGGNTEDDTEGCILVAYNRSETRIHGTAEKDLFELIKEWMDEGYQVRWRVFNKV